MCLPRLRIGRLGGAGNRTNSSPGIVGAHQVRPFRLAERGTGDNDENSRIHRTCGSRESLNTCIATSGRP